MSNKLIARSSIDINVPVSKAWQALVDPKLIKSYLFGTDAKSDWKKGSKITYTGEWQGKQYVDKGEIIEIEPEKKLHTTYLSGNSGMEDKPENYANVIYELTPHDGSTTVSISQDNIKDETGVQHMKENWGQVLQGMKKLLEQ